MSVLLVHKCVRNDYHCPTCRCYYISIHKSKDDAIKLAGDEVFDDDLDQLKKCNKVWIDEWVRRCNGDLFSIIDIVRDTTYDLSDIDVFNIEVQSNIDTQYMILNIKVRKSEWCPDNILFGASFYHTQDEAYEHLINDFMIENLDYEPLHKNKLNPIWIANPDSGDKDGDFYQIVELKYSEPIYVNGLCPYIGAESW